MSAIYVVLVIRYGISVLQRLPIIFPLFIHYVTLCF